MTDQELIDYYKNLLIIQYKDKDKAPQHIEALVSILVILELINEVKNGYNLDSSLGAVAEGVQLDVLGKYIGLRREALSLNDTDYINYLKFKIIKNTSNASLKEIDDLLNDFFGTTIYIDRDNLDMSIEYTFINLTPSFISVLISENLIPKPAAVQLIAILQTANPFYHDGGKATGAGYGKINDVQPLLDVNGDTVQDVNGDNIQVTINEAATGFGGEFVAAIDI
jgi:hypothetical protein